MMQAGFWVTALGRGLLLLQRAPYLVHVCTCLEVNNSTSLNLKPVSLV